MHAPPFGHVDVTGQTRYTFPKYQENGAATVRNLTILTSVVMLSACSSNPLAGLTRLSDVNVAENAVEVAVAEAVDVQPVAAQAPTPVETAAIETVTPEISSPADITDPAQKPGFFSRMLGGITSGATKSVQDSADPVVQDSADPAAQDTPDPAVVGVTADLAAPMPAPAPQIAQVAVPDTPDPAPVVAAATSVAAATPAPQRAGFFGRMFGGGRGDTPAATPKAEPAAAQAPAPRRGWFQPAPRTGPDAQLVSVGTQVPYGEIATNCDVKRGQLGTKIEESSGFVLYDTVPNATSLRTHYITGFKDRCARQFSAATALLGDVGSHEVLRYLPANKRRPYTDIDNAYEAIKSSFCRVGFGQPCGAKLDRLDGVTTFITAYRNFGANPTWSNILLHKGEVKAVGKGAR